MLEEESEVLEELEESAVLEESVVPVARRLLPAHPRQSQRHGLMAKSARCRNPRCRYTPRVAPKDDNGGGLEWKIVIARN